MWENGKTEGRQASQVGMQCLLIRSLTEESGFLPVAQELVMLGVTAPFKIYRNINHLLRKK